MALLRSAVAMRPVSGPLSAALLAAVCLLAGCHGELGDVPLADQNIYISDRFYDVVARGPEHAIVIGYGGKILETPDGGATWQSRPSGTDRALYAIDFGADGHGWIVGQQGTILGTTDGGKTWERQVSPTELYLFALHAFDRNRAIAVGDRSTVVETRDGGLTWTDRKIAQAQEGIEEDIALAVQDPIFYDVYFHDGQTGWIVGEFGKILHTTDGGATWTEQQNSLMGGGIVDMLDLPTLFGVHALNAREAIAAGLEGRIAGTTDGGATWRFEEIRTDVPLADPLYRPYVFPDGTAWAIGASGAVLTAGGRGQPWREASLGMEVVTWLRGMDFFDAQHGWIVGGYGFILRTDDGGKTWIRLLG